MPCGCFGKKKKKEETEKVPPSETKSSLPSDVKTVIEDESNKTAKRRDVVASDDGEECALLGYRPTGSRPPSSYVDSPTSNSHTHTPSTIPVVASSASSRSSSAASSPSVLEGDMGASCRAQLAEKRRAFFSDFYPEKKTSGRNLPSTLPTAARARQFGKVRSMRPMSQPTPCDPPVPEAPPPGPHLLRPTAAPRVPTKIDGKEGSGQESGFSSPHFLLELKNASDEISRRWAMSEEERECTPSSLKMKARTVKAFDESEAKETDREAVETDIFTFSAGTHSSNSVTSSSYSPIKSVTTQRSSVPETLITPPSPPSAEFAYEFSLSHTQSPTSDGVSETKETVEFDTTERTNFQNHSESAIRSQDVFDDLMKKISDLEDDSFDLSDEPVRETIAREETSHTNPRAEGGGGGGGGGGGRDSSSGFEMLHGPSSQREPNISETPFDLGERILFETKGNNKQEEKATDININISSMT